MSLPLPAEVLYDDDTYNMPMPTTDAYLQFHEVSQSVNLVHVNPGLPHQVQGPVFLHHPLHPKSQTQCLLQRNTPQDFTERSTGLFLPFTPGAIWAQCLMQKKQTTTFFRFSPPKLRFSRWSPSVTASFLNLLQSPTTLVTGPYVDKFCFLLVCFAAPLLFPPKRPPSTWDIGLSRSTTHLGALWKVYQCDLAVQHSASYNTCAPVGNPQQCIHHTP